ncbi:metallophosphoesterase family protein [Virgibacillus sp. W0181]|uniref:metallophosphoesterase family protein n=1 Tax=Virgibacillus sp. W0181 TaxID=3391581 RepID=UPI003F48DBBD
MRNKVLVMSDSHGLINEISEIKASHQCDFYIHCGDSELPLDTPVLRDFISVRGNCDFQAAFEQERFMMIGGIAFFITHGHLYNVKSDLISLAYRAQETNAQVVCFGHSHVAGVIKEGKQLFINPGSIRMPRGRKEKTYVIMEWNSSDMIHINFYTLTGEKVEALCNTFSLSE